MEQGIAPDWVAQVFPWIMWISVILGVVWLVLLVLDRQHRRAYNLTVADGSGGRAQQPGFLNVDQAKRDAAIKAGEAFDERAAREASAQQNAPDQPAGGPTAALLPTAQFGAGIFAILTLVTAVVGAFARIEFYDDAVRTLTSWERLVEIVTTYWLGFIVVVLLIAVQIYQFFRGYRRA